jgi:hypothetical protein
MFAPSLMPDTIISNEVEQPGHRDVDAVGQRRSPRRSLRRLAHDERAIERQRIDAPDRSRSGATTVTSPARRALGEQPDARRKMPVVVRDQDPHRADSIRRALDRIGVRRIVLLVNPSAGRGAEGGSARSPRAAAPAGMTCDIEFTSAPGEMRAPSLQRCAIAPTASRSQAATDR